MNKLPNKRSFNYDMKKLLGLEQPIPIPASEVVITISGLTGNHKWAGLENGTNYVDITEAVVTATKHRIVFTNPAYTNYQSQYGKLSMTGESYKSSTTHSLTVHFTVFFMASASNKDSFSNEASTPTTKPTPYVSALMNIKNINTFSFTHMGDNVTMTVSKGSLWSKGNM